MTKAIELSQLGSNLSVDSGKVGIGTDSPADKFTVYGAPASVWNTSTNNRVWSAGTTNGHGLMKIFRSDGTVFARFDSDAKKAGFGTDSPSEQLHVYATSGSDVKLKIENTATDSYPTLRLTNDARTYDLQIDGATDSFRIWDSTASAQRFTVKSDGNTQMNMP